VLEARADRADLVQSSRNRPERAVAGRRSATTASRSRSSNRAATRTSLKHYLRLQETPWTALAEHSQRVTIQDIGAQQLAKRPYVF
jgi:hypothetical protein